MDDIEMKINLLQKMPDSLMEKLKKKPKEFFERLENEMDDQNCTEQVKKGHGDGEGELSNFLS